MRFCILQHQTLLCEDGRHITEYLLKKGILDLRVVVSYFSSFLLVFLPHFSMIAGGKMTNLHTFLRPYEQG